MIRRFFGQAKYAVRKSARPTDMLIRGEILPIAAAAVRYPWTAERSRARLTARPTRVRGWICLCGAWATPLELAK